MEKLTFKRLMLTAMVAIAFATTTSYAQDTAALLDLLVKKKIVTQKEADALRVEAAKEQKHSAAASATAPADVTVNSGDKWKISSPVNEIELYGDTRVRYDYRGAETIGSAPLASPGPGVAGRNDWQERQRERYRLRIGLRGTLLDDWFFGLRIETGTNDRSSNITLGDDTSGNGPFAKNSDSIDVGQAYLGYKGFKDITLTAGRMPNPLVNTWMVWDPDINPEGVAEQWKHTYTFGGTSSAVANYSKDGKNMATVETKPITLDLFANFAQFVYDDANPENPLGSRAVVKQPGATTSQLIPNTDAWLLAWQVGAKLTLPNTFYVQLAPTLYNYSGTGDTFNIHYQGGSPTVTNAVSLAQNQNGINSLLVFDLPAEIGWKINKLPMRIFGDFAVNFEGDARAAAAGRPDKGDQRYAYVIGAGIGQLKAKHDFSLEAFWQHSEQYALDANLIDDDIFDAHLNMEGVGARASYNLSSAVSLNLTYNYGWRIDNSLGTGGAGALGINPADHYQLFMADINLKF